METGEQIKRLRKKREWSQLELAEKVGIDHTILSRIESGKRQVEDTLLRKFAGVFNVTTDHLLGHTMVTPGNIPSDYMQLSLSSFVTDNNQSIVRTNFLTPLRLLSTTNPSATIELIPVPVYNKIWSGDLTKEELLHYTWTHKTEIDDGDYFFLAVHQTNMADAGIRAGGLVLVRRQNTLKSGDIGLVNTSSNRPALITRFWRFENMAILLDDDVLGPMALPLPEIKIIGKAVETRFKL